MCIELGVLKQVKFAILQSVDLLCLKLLPNNSLIK